MKKIFTLFLISVMSLSAAAQPARMYLIGDATAGGWSLDDATLMVSPSDGVYEWVGALVAGRMKFVTHHDWLPSYGPAADNTPMAVGTVELTIRNTYEDGDNSFAVTAAGRYSLRLDLTGATPQLTVADGTSLPDKGYTVVYPEAVYAIGSATAAGWTLDNAIMMSETAYNSGIYQDELALQNGELKFLMQKDWGKAFGATVANAPLTGEGEYNIMTIDDSNDLKFSVSLAATTTYNITIDATTGKMTVAAKHGSALENVTLNGAMEVYDIQGRYVAASTADLPAGMYIVRTVSGTSKIIVY